VVARDPVAAEAAMRDHITSVIEALNSLAEVQARASRSGR
jgi:DNA-binding FadR family transcriptional regulator